MIKFKSSKKIIKGKDSLLTNYSVKSRYAESYRTLRTNLYFSHMEKDLNSLVVTSSMASEGKSNTVANLGFTIAQTGKKVLMVDSDLRKPGLSERFLLKKATGFANLVGDLLGRFLTKGRIEEYGLIDIITLTSLQKRTCIMNITDGANSADLFFLKGELVDIYWKNRPESKKLANTLVNENLLSKDQAALAMGHQKKSVRRLGAVLLTLGLVAEIDLNKILSLHMMEAFKVIMEMSEGDFFINPSTEERIKPLVTGGGSFQQLFNELVSGDDGFSFIQKEIDSSILPTDEKNLYILPAGSIPPNPSELIGSNRTEFLLDQLKQRFDIVILDTSPVMPASDALLLGAQVDGVLLVVKTGHTNRNTVKDTVQQLRNAKANLLGVLLNQADIRKDNYYKYYQSYYGE